MPAILILDGNSLANRAFYALPILTTPDGRPTNVLHGFMTMLLRLQQEQQPDYWLVAFDKTKATVRLEQYAAYKAQRKATPAELRPQFDYLKEVLAAFAVPQLELAGYEADDLIAAVTKRAEGQGFDVRIYTGDRDALQLLSPRTRVCLTKKGISEVECYDEAVLYERYRLRPQQIIDLKGLMGDASDNIPGVPGIGEKTALKLLWEFGCVEEVLAHSQEISGKKLQNVLQEYADQALLSKRLATMLHEIPIEIRLDDFAYRQPSTEAVLAVLDKYYLRNIQRLWQERQASGKAVRPEAAWGGATAAANITAAQAARPVPANQSPAWQSGAAKSLAHWPQRQLNNEDWLSKIAEWQRKRENLVLAYRYHGPNARLGRLQAWAAAIGGETFLLDLTACSSEVSQAWCSLLANQDVGKVMVDAKTVAGLLLAEGVELRGLRCDLALAAYLLDSARSRFAPLDLVRDCCPAAEPFADLADEAAALAQVFPYFEHALNEQGLTALLHEVEEPLSAVLARMEHHGIAIDTSRLEEFGRELTVALQRLESEVQELAGKAFNLNSPQQLGAVLFEKLGLPPAKKTKTGYSTDAETLEELRHAHPIIVKVLDYRQLSKLMSTYVNGLLAQTREGKIHTTFQQTVTATGRLSSTEPNLQNIPIRLEYGRQLRQVFKPTAAGWFLLSADYSQIELRILAHYAADELLIESFRLKQDVHARTAAEVFGVPLAQVTKEMRRRAKAVNFGLVYGLSDFGLARDLGISRKEAKFYIEQYFARYSGVKRYLTEVVAKAKAEGQVRTLLNRLRRIPELNSPNRTQRQFGERIAMNTPIQGTAADIMKLAMIDVASALQPYRAELLLQVHDELVLQVPPEELAEVAAMVKDKMENALRLAVPLTVECKVGPDWYAMEPWVPEVREHA